MSEISANDLARASTADIHCTASSYSEKILEQRFLADLMTECWQQERDVEWFSPAVDRGGYDVIVESNGVVRHVQLKSTRREGRRTAVDIQTRLLAKPSACVIWRLFDEGTLKPGPFLWFGSEPGQPIPDLGTKVTRHTRANSQGRKGSRPGLRQVRRSQFVTVETMRELVFRLFGVPRVS